MRAEAAVGEERETVSALSLYPEDFAAFPTPCPLPPDAPSLPDVFARPDDKVEGEMLTTDGYPCRTCGDERTKRRRGSFWLVLKEKELQGNTQTHSSESYKKVRGRGGGQYLVRGVCGGLAVGVVVRAIICVVLYSPSPG